MEQLILIVQGPVTAVKTAMAQVTITLIIPDSVTPNKTAMVLVTITLIA